MILKNRLAALCRQLPGLLGARLADSLTHAGKHGEVGELNAWLGWRTMALGYGFHISEMVSASEALSYTPNPSRKGSEVLSRRSRPTRNSRPRQSLIRETGGQMAMPILAGQLVLSLRVKKEAMLHVPFPRAKTRTAYEAEPPQVNVGGKPRGVNVIRDSSTVLFLGNLRRFLLPMLAIP